jgi:uncharacterized protein (DUF885 family)
MNIFTALQEEFFESLLARCPQGASDLGYTHHDTEMPSGKLEDRRREIEENKYFLTQFEDIDESQLEFDEKITRKLALHGLRIWLFVDETYQQYMRNPDCAGTISFALDSLFWRKSSNKYYPMIARLEKTPQYIKDFKTRVVTPVKLWTEMAIEGGEGLIPFLNTITKAAQKEIPSTDAEEIENHVKKVEESLNEYNEFLRGIIPKAVTSWAMDKKTFDRLLELRGFPYSGDEILALGHTWYKEEQQRLQTLAETIAHGKSVQEVTDLIKDTHPPTFEEVLQVYRKHVKKARKFLIDNDIVTIPEGEQFHVDVMPEYLRYFLPLAACHSAPIVGEDRIGYLFVTPHEDTAFLREHSEPSIILGCIHEGYPGHHIQLWCSGLHPHRIRWSLIPGGFDALAVSGGVEMVEGWAHYCEEMMMEKGFCTTKEYQFMQSRDVLWRAARIIVDVQLSRGEMTFSEAVQFLENMGMERTVAIGEVKWYSLLPSYPLSYLLGKHILKELKENVKKKMGTRYTDKFFHDTLIYEGTMPLTLFEEVFNHKLSGLTPSS